MRRTQRKHAAHARAKSRVHALFACVQNKRTLVNEAEVLEMIDAKLRKFVALKRTARQ
jgi:hypothetical protein